MRGMRYPADMSPTCFMLSCAEGTYQAEPFVFGRKAKMMQVAARAKRRSEVLPYAVNLAAATSVESPFVHLDSIPVPLPAEFFQAVERSSRTADLQKALSLGGIKCFPVCSKYHDK